VRGTLFLIVGPSGAGKDTLIDGARAALAGDPRFVFARRIITRPKGAVGEDHEAVSSEEFERRAQAGGFLLHWGAHGLLYGLPGSLEADLAAGRHVVANVSRTVIAAAAARCAAVRVIVITAAPEVRAKRLAARGREDPAGAASRLARTADISPDVATETIVNDGAAGDGIARLVSLLKEAPCSA
jgi:thymidine phosphorylase